MENNTPETLSGQQPDGMSDERWFYCSVVLLLIMAISHVSKTLEAQKQQKLKKLKKLNKTFAQQEQAKSEQQHISVSLVDNEQDLTKAIDKLGLRAERINSDIGTTHSERQDKNRNKL